MDALKKLEALYGVKIESPQETQHDLIRQAQAVLFYFEAKGKGFRELPCRWCEQPFAYSWDVAGVQYCSIPCMVSALKDIGITWNPTKPPEDRWGRTIPAVVPPQALEILQDLVSIQEDPIPDIVA